MPERIGHCVTRLAEYLCAAGFAGVFLVFVYKIAMRYLAGEAVAWADEVSVVLFVWLVFIANAAMVPDRKQITFDLLYTHVGPRTQRLLAIARLLLIGGIFAVALPGSLDYIAFLWRERTPVLLMRLDIVYACFGVFMLALLIRTAHRLIRLLGRDWRSAL